MACSCIGVGCEYPWADSASMISGAMPSLINKCFQYYKGSQCIVSPRCYFPCRLNGSKFTIRSYSENFCNSRVNNQQFSRQTHHNAKDV